MTISKKFLLILVALLAVTTAASAKRQPAIFNKVDKRAMNAWVDKQFKAMTPDERITQLFVMAVDPRNTVASETVKKLVSEFRVGGLIFNESDIVSQAKITNYAQSLAKVPLLITLDAEWGPSMRLEDAPKFPRNLYLGAISDDAMFYNYGREVARELKRLGVNVDFAPVLDVVDRPGTVVGARSYGSDPELVSRHGIAFARGLEDGGILSVGKHFPGHGSTTADSHKTLPTVDKSLKELELFDFVPFKRYIDAGLGGMLTAHLYIPAISRERKPGTMSPRYVTDLLQKKMGFDGLIFTDALGMEGAKAVGGSVCVGALLAGNDVLLMPDEVPGQLAAIKAAIASGKLKQKLIDERCKKMLRFKYALGLYNQPKVDIDNIVADVNDPCAAVLKRQLAAASITVVRDAQGILPVKGLQNRRIAVVTMGNENDLQSMFQRRCANYAQCTPFNFNLGGDIKALADQVKASGSNVLILSVASSDYVAAARYLASHFADHLHKVIVAVMSDPQRLDEVGALLDDSYVSAAVLAYDNSTVSEDYLAQTIFGGNAARGVLPVNVKTGKPDGGLKAGTGIKYDACRLGYTIPAEVGFKPSLTALVDSVCRYGVQQHAFSGCEVVVARHGKIVFNRAYGEIDYDSGIPVTENTLFGLASVSKATGTLSGVMKCYDEGKFQLDDKVSTVIPGMRNTDEKDITFREMLYHESGLPPELSMWYMMFDPKTYTGPLFTSTPNQYNTIKFMNNAYGNKFAKLRTDILSTVKTDKFNWPIAAGLWGGQVTYDSIMNRIYHQQLHEKRYVYSDLNFALLGNAVQNMSGMPLNYFVENNFFAPLGAYHTLYRPLSRFAGSQIAYTEYDPFLRHQHVHGYVHDELAAFSGGVQGNAGLFSNANDLCKLLQMWLNGGTYGGQRFLKASTVETFTTEKSTKSHRGLGFDKPQPDNLRASSTCDEAPAEVYGHTGFTGTCFWVDPKNDMIYIFLSNRVNPTRNNPAFTRVSARSHIQSILYKSIVK